MTTETPRSILSSPQPSGPPLNPFYTWQYSTTIPGGRACLEFSAPKNQITAADAECLIEFLELPLRQLRRIIEKERTQQ